MKILVTGGAGFIGSNFVHHVIGEHKDDEITVIDDLTYAGRKENLQDVMKDIEFVKGDIADEKIVSKLVKRSDAIVNFAAETHVDRSILSAGDFVRTNVFGVHTLMEASKKFGIKKFVHISTDEVYGSIDSGSFKETDMLNPSSPYAASKAAADLLARSYFITHNVPLVITRTCNNFGPFEHIEKFIPKVISNAIQNKHIPIYGDGTNMRDWIFVNDNCKAVYTVLEKGKLGEIYNISADKEMKNIDLAIMILEIMGKPSNLIEFVKDRPGHDRRYSIDCSKIKSLGWKPEIDFEQALGQTIEWYHSNKNWWKSSESDDFHTRF
ncbi:dTDP-glucose 4,6-dehydratase [archaeon]|nr:MAG: dTDP-glucose 4,6-dehydratase [archaeon]